MWGELALVLRWLRKRMILLLIQIAKRKKRCKLAFMNWFPNRKSGSRKVVFSNFFLKMFFERKKFGRCNWKFVYNIKKVFAFFLFSSQKSIFVSSHTKKVGSELSPATVFLERMLDESSFVLRCPKYFCKHALTLLQTLLCNLLRVPRPKWANMGSFELRLFSLKCGTLEHSTIAPPILCKNNCAGFESCCLSFSFAKFNWFFLSAKSRLDKMSWYP